MTHDFQNLEQSRGVPMLAARADRRQQAMTMRQQGVKIDALTFADFFPQRMPMTITAEGVAIIHLANYLGKGLLGIDKFFGDTDYDDVSAEVAEAAENRMVRAIALLGDSPGGMVTGCPESADVIRAAAKIKPVGAWSETICASACYELVAPASMIYGSRSGNWGSIGVICTWQEVSGYLEQMGVAVHQIAAPGCDLKDTFSSYKAPTAAHLEYVNDLLAKSNAQFRADVLASRPDIEPDSMRGQCFAGPEAMQRGLIDEVTTFQEFYADLLSLA